MAFLFSQPFTPPEKSTPPIEEYLPHPPPEWRQKKPRLQRLRINLVTLMHPPARKSSLVGQRLQAALGAAAALAAISLSPGSAQALVVNVGNQIDSMSTLTGPWTEYGSVYSIGALPCWYNQVDTDAVTATVNTQLGYAPENAGGSFFLRSRYLISIQGTAARCSQSINFIFGTFATPAPPFSLTMRTNLIAESGFLLSANQQAKHPPPAPCRCSA